MQWTINKGEIIETLENDPLIKNVEVETKLPWTVEIQLVEHERVGYIKKENEFYPVLGNGTVLEESKINRLSGDAPLLLSFSQEDMLVEMSKELSNLPKNILNIISEIHWTPTDKNKNDITLFMTDGFMVQSSIRNFSEKMKVYPSIASQLEPGSEGIIHIGVGAYFEPFNQEITEEEIISTEGDE